MVLEEPAASPRREAESTGDSDFAPRREQAPAHGEVHPDPRTGLWPRCLGRAVGPGGRPILLCIGGMHGNEPAGVLGLLRVFARLAEDSTGLVGELIGFSGNRKALRTGARFLRHDLNRCWTAERVAALAAEDGPLEDEDEELRELDCEFRAVVARDRRGLFALDLHTTSGSGPAFAILDDTLPNRDYAMPVPVPLVVGIEEELAGTVTHHLHDLGFRVFGFEAGQHAEPISIDRAAAAVWLAMETSGVLEPGVRPEVEEARELLRASTGDLPHVVEVRYRHPVAPTDDFRMRADQEFLNFDQVRAGQILAYDKRGPIHAPDHGLILMPLYQAQGEDGFFLVRRLRPSWLKLSAKLRSMGAERILPRLPGVTRHPELDDSFVVDRRWARFLAKQLFHLLGYRRRGPAGRYLVMTRRSHDDS